MTVWFDMDGTISDLYAVPGWLSKLRAFDPSPYREAAPLCDFEKVLPILHELQNLGVKIGIISWCSKASTREYDNAVRRAKKEWLRDYLPGFIFDEIHIVKYGTPKQTLSRRGGILIDDEALNRERWTKGISYDPNEKSIVEILQEILRNY